MAAARESLDDRPAAGAGVLAFAAPLHVRADPTGQGEAVTVAGIDDALAALCAAGPLRYGACGPERAEWSEAFERAAGAKFDRTPEAVETARRAFRAYAAAVGILITVRTC